MAQQQSSRLNRLLTLLDTGSTQSTRFTAARQIGEIAKSHPQELNPLLSKVSQYLRSKNWDTRVAAAQAIGAIAANVKHTTLSELCSCVESKILETGIPGLAEEVVAWSTSGSKILAGISFKSFDINKVLDFGALLASGGQEYDVGSDIGKNPRERLARQKQNLKRRLGLDVCEQFMDVNEMIRDEDLIVSKNSDMNGVPHRHFTQSSVHRVQQLVSNMVPAYRTRRPSARELNLLKRKAKINSRDQTKIWNKEGDLDTSNSQEMVSPKGFCSDSSSSNKMFESNPDEDLIDHDGDGTWPFHNFVEQLIIDMFDPIWEVRHGSVMALREILTYQGACSGVFMPELNFDGEKKDNKGISLSLKRARDTDHNIHVPTDEMESNLKRPKVLGVSSPSEDSKVSFSTDVNRLDVSVKVEDGCWKSSEALADVELSVCSIKTEPQSYVDDLKTVDMAEAKTITPRDGVAIGNMGTIDSLPENCELMNLIKVARHSWLKNCEFLQDSAIRILCVLILDRFGDYVSDQVVAPVRETCAQALGVVLKYMHPALVHETLNILLQMQHRPEWEVRHGSLLGIKYLVAVRQEMLHNLLAHVIPACKAGLEDPDDDVRSVAADALIPAASAVVSLKGHILYSIIMLLWDILLDLDDLSPSTSSVMNLLAEIYSQDEMIPSSSKTEALEGKNGLDLNEMVHPEDIEGIDSQENPFMLSMLAPRLWPFMRHSITSVRASAIRTLERLLEAGCKRKISDSSTSCWPSFILGDTLRIVFQNMLLESKQEILQCSERVWRLLLQSSMEDLEGASKLYISSWIELASTSYGSALDATKMFWPLALPRRSHFKAVAKLRAAKLENNSCINVGSDSAKGSNFLEKNVDTSTGPVKIIVGADTDMSVTCTRAVTTMALGLLAARLHESCLQCLVDPLWKALTSFSGVQRQVASMVLISWFRELKSSNSSFPTGLSNNFKSWLFDLLACSDPAFPTKGSLLPYSELSRTYSKMRNEASQLFHAVESSGMFNEVLPVPSMDPEVLSTEDAMSFAAKLKVPRFDTLEEESVERNIGDDIESLKQRLAATAGYLKCVQGNLHVAVSALVAASIVWMADLPSKLNPIILPLMASIKREQEEILQDKAAEALAELIYECVARKPGPNDKLIKNIFSLTWTDPCETPQAGVLKSMDVIEDQDLLSFGNSFGKQKSKAPILASGEDRSRVEGFISRRGSELALRHLCKKFGASLFEKLPKVWDCITETLKPVRIGSEKQVDIQNIEAVIQTINDPQILINNIQVVRSIAPLLDKTLWPTLLTLLPCIFICVRHFHVAVRLAASRCITSMAKSMTMDVMGAVIENVIPMLGDMTSVYARQGAGMLVSLLVKGLGVVLVPYAPLLVVPLLRCMSDCDQCVRQSVTHSFAALVPLLPLARGISPPVVLSEDLSRNKEDAEFLEQLVDNSHIEDFKLPIDLKVELRRYQQEGINWLAFLRRFNLHGILCDDMGLGKTLQATAIVASDIAEHRATDSKSRLLPSLIICPSTLVGHWVYEIEKFVDPSLITTIQYVGSAQERISLRSEFNNFDVTITSYDVVRKDIEFLEHLLWNYCILDEGHIIKNSKSKVTCAVKQLKAQHRLILSGTPIQNNVLDLWSLFDFLMPGFLGTDRQFQAAYGKPLVAARDPKCSAKDAEAGVLAMEALHKQVMPFLLRRTKDEVLSDLPEKIIQDRYCDLSPVQLKLYEQFSGSHVRQEISTIVNSGDSGTEEVKASSGASSHVFQALQYLLKLCSHPILVLGEKIPDSVSGLLSELLPPGCDIIPELHKLRHSPKLVALQQILEECGIGIDSVNSDSSGGVGQHRVLIFAQHKALLDIIERDLFHTYMKSVTYLRLDGSVESEKRFDIVKTFNSDPTIDVLLLTTHVGGLGLNLTSADTLVFMEHDWNPMRDHQAMDRAHRLGQRKVVNVHRLIMRGTLEEKVMSLQKFKVSVANAIINVENSSMKTMNTDQLLDLFTPAENKKGPGSSRGSDRDDGGDSQLLGTGKGMKSILSGLEELWDQSQYTEEYSLNHFLAKLNG
ncbi:TATA-binding protein-associated factor BTAF1 [Impatiens glandulifera]|uniref:TATA-binding protein-associated factor BTAF1 n=1 Tax=Impatiens glandulifera TaxID=253017 RepID=UPI001FB089A2|nr:TATA-binding protein-associated factor BTAF1 [Impatiens glandulifera]